MKSILLILIILISLNNYSQNHNEKKLKKIESFGIILTNYNLNEKRVNNDWNLILDINRKRKITKTTAIIFTSLSVLSTAFGAKLISENKDSKEGVGQSIGTIFIAGGVASAGISVHLFNIANKRKKERNKLIEHYNKK